MPFQLVAIDLCKIGKHTYLVCADRLSGWTEVMKIKDESFKSVKKHLLAMFERYGVPEEISSDGGPPFNSNEYKRFLERWNVEIRLSSAYYAQSNGRAEVAVKTVKRLLLGNLNPITGEVDTEQAARALLAHRNTPSQNSHISPSEMLYGHKIRDHLPNKFRKLRKDWKAAKRMREMYHTRPDTKPVPVQAGKVLKPLNVGDAVAIQNQRGNKPKKWHSTGQIVEVMPHRKYKIVVDGSRNITHRNRRFVRPIVESCRNRPDPGSQIRQKQTTAPEMRQVDKQCIEIDQRENVVDTSQPQPATGQPQPLQAQPQQLLPAAEEMLDMDMTQSVPEIPIGTSTPVVPKKRSDAVQVDNTLLQTRSILKSNPTNQSVEPSRRSKRASKKPVRYIEVA